MSWFKILIFAFITFFTSWCFSQNLSFSGGQNHGAILCENGRVFTFGEGNNGELGTNGTGNSNNPTQVVGLNATGFLDDVKQVDAGSGSFVIALDCQDEVYIWGDNTENQLAQPNSVSESLVPIKVPGIGGTGNLGDIRFVSGGSAESYAITNSNRIVAWGGNDYGQLGRGTITAAKTGSSIPQFVQKSDGTILEDVKLMDAGDDFGVALLNDGTVWFWGKDARGVGGQGGVPFDDRDDAMGDPVPVPNNLRYTRALQVKNTAGTGFLEDIVKITAGDRHILALDKNGNLWAWGNNSNKQIGDGVNGDKSLPVRVQNINGDPGILENVKSISAGNAHSIALLNDGTVVTWGRGRDGQLGQSSIDNVGNIDEPRRVLNPAGNGNLTNITAISDGDKSSFAINTTGTVYAWGLNSDGELGLNSNVNEQHLPKAIPISCPVSDPDEIPSVDLGVDLEYCPGSANEILTANSNDTDLKYQWYENDVRITGENSSTYSASDSGRFTVIVINEVTKCGTTDSLIATDEITLTCPPCPDPGVITLKGQGNTELDSLKVCGSQVLEVLINGATRANGFQYQFFYNDGNGFVSQGGFSNASTFTALATGDYTVSVKVSGEPCFKTDTIHFRRDLNPTVSDAGLNKTVCVSDTSLSANTPATGTGVWSLKTGTTATIDDLNDTETEVSNLQDGDNTFIWTITNGVCAPSSSEVTITKQVQPTKPNLGIDTTICGDVISLTAPAIIPVTASGEWSLVTGNATFNPSNSVSTNITGLAAGQNVVKWVVTNGICADSSTKRIISITPPTQADAGPDDTVSICVDDFTLTGNSVIEGTGLWTQLAGSGNLNTPSDPNSDLTNISDGTERLVWTISKSNCPSTTDTLTILKSSIAIATVSISSNTIFPICGASPITFTASPNAEGNAPVYQWFKNGIPVGTNSTTYIENSPANEDSVYVELTSNLGCVVDKIVESDTIAILIDENPSGANAGSGGSICSPSFALNATAPTVGTGNWDNGITSATFVDASSPTTTANNLAQGANELFWITSNGVCPNDTGRITITVSGNLTKAVIIPENDSLCIGDDYAVSANTPLVTETGTWITKGDGTFANNTNSSTSYSPSSSDISSNMVELVWEIDNGVCDPSRDSILVRLDNQIIADVGLDTILCSTETSLELDANVPSFGSGTWVDISGTYSISDRNNPMANLSGISSDISLNWIVKNGACEANDIYNISLVSSLTPAVTIDYSKTNICEGDLVIFTALPKHGGPGPVYEWTINSVTQPETIASISRDNLTDNSIVKVRLTSNNTCVSDPNANSLDNTPISVSKEPVSLILPDNVSICETDQTNLSSSILTPGSNYTWLKNNEIQNTGIELNEITISEVTQTGLWTLKVDNGVCPEITSPPVNVNVDENPLLSIVQDPISDNQVTLIGTSSIGTTSWSSSTNLSSNTDLTTIFDGSNSPLNNIITLRSVNGECTATNTTNVLIVPQIAAPNVFTPNGDGQNETFVISGMEARPNATVSIFNRWGTKIYETKNYIANEWDGENVPDGVYYFIVETEDENNFTGVIHIVR